MAAVRLERVRKTYQDKGREHVVVHDLDLEVADGEFLVLVGPSGCGKSTTLRMIAGLETVTAGTVRIGDRVVNDVPARDRDIAMVFQNYALYPHMTVRDNLAFALELRKLPKAEIAERVAKTAEMLGLEHLLDRRPRQLSGGQRQRVAVGRAIVRDPRVFLFDEPLSNLDAKLRGQTRRQLAALRRRLGTTTIYVTHDQVEAMTMGDRIVVMHEGRVQQAGPPMALYQRPVNTFVAAFLGSPPMNLLAGQVVAEGSERRFETGAASIPLPDSAAWVPEPGRPVILGIRPEGWQPAAPAPLVTGIITELEPLGNESLAVVDLGGVTVTVRAEGTLPLARGDRLPLAVPAPSLHWFDAATETRLEGRHP